MNEELENFKRNQVWVLVDPHQGCKPIGTKWVWKNKEGECQMVRSGQPTGVLIPVVYLFGGGESKAKNLKGAHEYAEYGEHSKFILVRASVE
jgi:hypothetical protein